MDTIDQLIKEQVKEEVSLAPIKPEDYLMQPIKNVGLLEERWFKNAMKDIIHLEKVAGTLTPAERLDLQDYLVRRTSSSGGAAVMICPGEASCPIIKSCWLKSKKKPYPVGHPCPIETMIQISALTQYSDEFNLKSSEAAKQQLVSELVVLKVYEERIKVILGISDRAGLTVNQTTGYDEDGNPIENKVIAPEWEIWERITMRRDKIYKALVGTPYEIYRRDAALKNRNDKDVLKDGAEKKSKWDEYREEFKID